VSERLQQLTARRRALQLQCSQQRDDVALLYGGIEASTARVDRLIGAARSVAPVVALGGFALMLALGPGRALRMVRRAATAALYATQALRLLR